jgi:S-adenosyl methyltransferase
MPSYELCSHNSGQLGQPGRRRPFHQRAARWLAAGRGISQFIDLGSGLPVPGNTHDVVQAVEPRARVLYVDIDAMVRAYAAELLADDGTTAVITADLRDPDRVLSDPRAARAHRFQSAGGASGDGRPAVRLGRGRSVGLIERYVSMLAPGSYLVLSHVTYEGLPPSLVQTGRNVYARTADGIYPRSRADVQRFFTGLEIVPPYEGADPAVTHIGLWGAEDPDMADSDGSRWWFGAVARRP